LAVDEAQTLAQWGVAAERLGDERLAQTRYERALELDPENGDAHYNLSVIYWKKADWAAAVSHLQSLARAHPEDPRWRPYLGRALEHLQRH
jgi:Flp pilus assembly protein TadD